MLRRLHTLYRKSGIKGRLAALMLAIGLLLLAAVLGIMIPFFRWNITRELTSQQAMLLTTIRNGLDNQLETAMGELAAVAEVTPPEALHRPDLAKRFLENRVGIARIFDDGLLLTDREGRLVALATRHGGRPPLDPRLTGLLRHAAMEAGRSPVISPPLRSAIPPHHPVALFSAPIRDRSGEVIGLLSGGIRLDATGNIIGAIARQRIGRTGYLYLVDHNRRIITHPDPAKLLAHDLPPGADRQFDRALEGLRDCAVTTGHSRGLITSFCRLRSAPWLLVVSIAQQEAFAPAQRAIMALTAVIITLGLIGIALSWWVLRSITNPLLRFTGYLAQLQEERPDHLPFAIEGHPPHELLVLIDAFTCLQSRLDQQHRQLLEQTDELAQEVGVRKQAEEQLQLLLARQQATASMLQNICDNVPDLIWAKDLQHRYLFTNKANNETLLFPETPDEPIGKLHDLFAARIMAERPDNPDWYRFSDLCARSDETTLASRQPMRFQEYGMVKGELVCLDVYKAPLYAPDGELLGTVGSARIVTRENRLEQENARLSRLYRLLSEVNRLIVRTPEPHELFQAVCDSLVADNSFVMAWIGLPDGMGGYVPAVAAGIDLTLLAAHGSLHPEVERRIVTEINETNCAQELCHTCCDFYQHKPFCATATYLVRPLQATTALLVMYTADPQILAHESERRLLDELAASLAYALDAAERERLRNLDRQQLELAATVFANSNEGIAVTDTEVRFISVNQAFCAITGFEPHEVIGRTPRLLKSGRHDRSFYQTLWRDLLGSGRWQGEIWNRRKNGEIYPELLSIAAVKDGSGAVTRYIAVATDISETKQSRQQIEYLEWRDPLTDLPNRRMLSNHLAQALELTRRRSGFVALLSLDLDHFKDINDSFGHLTGDTLLQLAARRLRERMRASDLVARLGGDEFMVVLEGLDHRDRIPTIATEVLALLQQPFTLENGVDLQISASIGISLFPDNGQSAPELLQQADAALFQAKQQGRSRFAYFNDEMTARAVERINLGNHLRQAVARNELQVYYQPQVDLATGRIVGAEALMRWASPNLGMVSPTRFIPLAEEIGAIIPMGAWILRQVCLQGRAWLDEGLPPLHLAVNLSPLQTRQPGLAEQVAEILADTGYPAAHLELELTESALMQREQEIITLFHALKRLGIGLALDDFGTGYSSLAYLKHFPLDLLKIDKSFVDDLPHGLTDGKIATTIVQMGRSLGIKLLAEGVEQEGQRVFLQALGCDLYQGYLFSEPLPADRFAALLRSQHTGGDDRG